MPRLITPTLTAPGVYVVEVPQTARRVVGAPTAVTAFLGRTPMGPIDTPIEVTSFATFSDVFGGLSFDHPLTYAVRDFFDNGGATARIVRLFSASGSPPNPAMDTASSGPVMLTTGQITFAAANPGAWGDDLTVEISAPVAVSAAFIAANPGLGSNPVHDVTVRLSPTGQPERTERFQKVSLAAGPRSIATILAQSSQFVRATVDPTAATATAVTTPAFTGGQDGQTLAGTDYYDASAAGTGRGLRALPEGSFNLLSIPPDLSGADVPLAVYQDALAVCAAQRAMLLIDPPLAWEASAAAGTLPSTASTFLDMLGGGTTARNAAIYFPSIVRADPVMNNQPRSFPPSGAVAGVMSRIDSTRGVWKAPAGTEASLQGVQGLSYAVDDALNGQLNDLAVNSLRTFGGYGSVVWGARTLRGATDLADEYQYLSVRRLALFLEESLQSSTLWATFEPNAEPLWADLRGQITTFMNDLMNLGAFVSFQVTVDETTMTPADIAAGILKVHIAFAPVKPAEFVVLYFEQTAGQVAG